MVSRLPFSENRYTTVPRKPSTSHRYFDDVIALLDGADLQQLALCGRASMLKQTRPIIAISIEEMRLI
jgi:hypothetical protein